MQKGVRLTTETFIEKAKEIHKSKYNYSKIVFTRTKDKVCVICPVHGEFFQRADAHLSGHGCPKCSPFAKISFTEFCERQHKVYGNYYSYEEATYSGLVLDTRITCPVHGQFTKTPNNHLQGQGCPSCSKAGIGIYVLKCADTGLVKIGVTSELSRRLKELPKTMEVIFWTETTLAFATERQLHKKYSKHRTNHPRIFGGRTEFFRLSQPEIAEVLQDVEYLILK